jgi:hypothetical protein
VETESAVIKYARVLYAILDSYAVDNEYGERIYTGFISEAYKDLGASSSYYTRIMRILVKVGAIEQVQRGARTQPSVIWLKGMPEEISPEGLTTAREAATLLAELERRTSALESWRETTGGLNIQEAFRNMENRLSKLERKREVRK